MAGNGAGPPRPRVYRLRLALILAGLGALAVVSTVFGMMMAVAADLPNLENRQEYRYAKNSVLYDIHGKQVGVLTGKENRILVSAEQVSPAMKHAIISIEDKRFFEHSGVDPRGIGRALLADIGRKRAVQGASTIPQQFVKNALAAQSQRTVFQKLRESAMAYHLTRKWSKQKILSEYLNSVYFGNGAYGVESAARTYFSFNHSGCGQPGAPTCASQLTVPEAALIAGLVASPSAFDPIVNPQSARRRRELVLNRMADDRYITSAEVEQAKAQPLPNGATVTLPREDSDAPYFTTWVKGQIVERFGAQRALNGGLKVKTTLDLEMQRAAEQAITSRLSSPTGPAAALVAIDNRTGEVRAMVGGRPGKDYNDAPFNLATQGQRQPGSAFKPFVLAQALRSGISPDSVWASERKLFDVPGSADANEKFVVRNNENQYLGSASLATATAQSDNSVYAEVGIKVGPAKIARLAQQMGIRTPISSNPAMTLGGLKQGVTPLDMAHAYQTIAAKGQLVSGSLGAPKSGPVGVHEVKLPGKRGRTIRNERVARRVVSPKLAEVETELLKSVISEGTGRSAATGNFAAGKTGTTENYGDAWFVGYNEYWTVAVWVGYPDRLKPMETDYNGGPVKGGTYPAEIWREFMLAAETLRNEREAARAAREGREYIPPESDGSSSGESTEGSGEAEGGESSSEGDGSSSSGEGESSAPSSPAPSAPAPSAPAPSAPPSPPPSSGGGTGAGGGTAPG